MEPPACQSIKEEAIWSLPDHAVVGIWCRRRRRRVRLAGD